MGIPEATAGPNGKGPARDPAVAATCLHSCPLSWQVLASLLEQTQALQLLTQVLKAGKCLFVIKVLHKVIMTIVLMLS